MGNLSTSARLPALFFWAFLLVTSAAKGAYYARHLDPSGPFILIEIVGFLWAIENWFEVDSRQKRVKWVWDMGWFLFVAGPFILPYYLWKTRGVKTVLMILAFLAVYLGGVMIGLLLLLIKV